MPILLDSPRNLLFIEWSTTPAAISCLEKFKGKHLKVFSDTLQKDIIIRANIPIREGFGIT